MKKLGWGEAERSWDLYACCRVQTVEGCYQTDRRMCEFAVVLCRLDSRDYAVQAQICAKEGETELSKFPSITGTQPSGKGKKHARKNARPGEAFSPHNILHIQYTYSRRQGRKRPSCSQLHPPAQTFSPEQEWPGKIRHVRAHGNAYTHVHRRSLISLAKQHCISNFSRIRTRHASLTERKS